MALSDDAGQAQLDRLEQALKGLSHASSDAEEPFLVSWALSLLQSSFHGTSSLPAPWAAVRAMGRAFPLLLGKDIAAAQEDMAGQEPKTILTAWAHLALQSGSFGHLIRNLPTQPQVACAYGQGAVVRSKAFMQQAATRLQDAQADISEHLSQVQLHCTTATAPGVAKPLASTSSPAASTIATAVVTASLPGNPGDGSPGDWQLLPQGPEVVDPIQTPLAEGQQDETGQGEKIDTASGLGSAWQIETEEDALQRRREAAAAIDTVSTGRVAAAAAAAAAARTWMGVGARYTMDYARQGLAASAAVAGRWRSGGMQGGASGVAGPGSVRLVLTVEAAGGRGESEGVSDVVMVALPGLDHEDSQIQAASTSKSTSADEVVRVQILVNSITGVLPVLQPQQLATTTAVVKTATATAETTTPPVTAVASMATKVADAGLPPAMAPAVYTEPPSPTPSSPDLVDMASQASTSSNAGGAAPMPAAASTAAVVKPSGLSYWVRGTAVTTASVAASAAGLLSSVPWRQATTSALGSVTSAAAAMVTASRTAATPATQTTTTTGDDTTASVGACAAPQADAAAKDSVGADNVAGSGMVEVKEDWQEEEDDEFDVLEDMREVLQGQAGLVGYDSGPPSGPSHSRTNSGRLAAFTPLPTPLLMQTSVGSVAPESGSGVGQSQLQTLTPLPALGRQSAGHTRHGSADLGRSSFGSCASSSNGGSGWSCSGRGVPAQQAQLQPPQQVAVVFTCAHVVGSRQLHDPHGELYTAYCVEVQDVRGNTWQVLRRFSEFVLLKKGLVSLQHHLYQRPSLSGSPRNSSRDSISTYSPIKPPWTSPSKPLAGTHDTSQVDLALNVSAGGLAAEAAPKSTVTSYTAGVVGWEVQHLVADSGGVVSRQPAGMSPSRRNSRGVGTKSSRVTAVVVPECWDEVSQGRGILGRARLSSDVISTREALLSRCLTQLIAVNDRPWPQPLQDLVQRFLAPPPSVLAMAAAHAGDDSGGGAGNDESGTHRAASLHASFQAPSTQFTASNSAQDLPVTVAAPLSRSTGDVSSGMQVTTAGASHSHATSQSRTSDTPAPITVASAEGMVLKTSNSHRQTTSSSASAVAVGGGAGSGLEEERTAGSELSMTVRLMLDLHPEVTDEELHRKQRGECAGCRATMVLGVAARTWLGGGVSRTSSAVVAKRCWYTYRLYCSSCQRSDTHFIPALVVHNWDLTPRPVCCAAAEFLAAVRDQPLLCVPALNPSLFSRVPALASAASVRRRITDQLDMAETAGGALAERAAAIRAAAGVRSYLLTPRGVDFWALSDLVDLSLGPFAKMPGWLDRVGRQAAALAAAVGSAGGS